MPIHVGLNGLTAFTLDETAFSLDVTPSRKHALYNIYPLKPHFYVVKLGFTGVYIIFLISAQEHILWVLVRTSRSGSNEYPQPLF